MTFTKKLLTAVTGTVVAAAIGVGAMASAAEPTPTPTPTSTPALTTQQKCDREPAITARYDQVHARLQTRLTHLNARHDKAVAEGHTHLAQRLQRVIDRVQHLSDRVTARYTKYETWVAANCPTP